MNVHSLFPAIVDALDIPVFTLNRAYRYTYFNAAHAQTMRGIYGADIALDHNLAEYQTPEDWQVAKANLDRVLAGERLVVRSDSGAADKERRFFESVHEPLRNESDAIVGVTVIAHDITEREQVLAALQHSEKRFRSLVENSADAIGLLAPDGRVIYDSPAAPRMLGYGSEEWLGKSALMLIHPDDLPDVNSKLGALLATPSEHTHSIFRLRHKDGRWLWIEATATNLLAEPSVQAIVVNYRDVSQRVETEQQLRASETRLREVWETTSDAMALSDANGVVLAANPAFLKLYGFSTQEIIGKSFALIFPEDARAAATAGYRQVFKSGTASPVYEAVVQRADGSPRVVESQATFITTGEQRTLMLSSIRDITERKAADDALRESNRQLGLTLEELQRTQTQLVRQERLAAVGQLAAGIAHDFNNILSVIILQMQLALRSAEMSPTLRDRVNVVFEQAGRASNLVQQILDFSRSAILQTRTLEVWPFFEEQVALLRRTIPEHIQIRLSGRAQGATLNADPARLQQLLTNLAINARDAMAEGGELEISLILLAARNGDSESLVVTPTPLSDVAKPDVATSGGATPVEKAAWLRITVRDTGSGISDAALAHIFEPFFTTKEPGQGTGLGLAQVYGIVKQHNGFIEVQSTPGTGTVVTIDLPLVSGVASSLQEARTHAVPLGHDETILVVEDDPGLRAVLVDTLHSLNYRALTAHDGMDALTRLTQPVHEIALVLSDLTMPNLGGQALFEELTKRGQKVPVVILSGHAASEELQELTTRGLAGWLPKPPDMTQLAQLLAEILDKPNAPAS